MKLDLNANWKVRRIAYEDSMDEFLSPNFLPQGWLEAKVPEEIHATLRRAGVIRGNTYSKTEAEEQWIEECDWVYYKAFYVPEEWKDKELTTHF